MCGVAGSVNHEVDAAVVFDGLWHRGPDAQGDYRYKNCQLFHTRLAIQDVQHGQQPMKKHDCVVVLNGEIYNHIEIRKGLQGQFTTRSDTETLLQLYYEKGLSALQEIDGMFACAILDQRSDALYLIRDRAGKKPLYWYLQNRKLVFASELNTLRRMVRLSIFEEHIQAFLRLGYFFREDTPYKDVRELSSGAYIKFSLSNLTYTSHQWWSIFDLYSEVKCELPYNQILSKLDAQLNKAVKLRLDSSDLEVGTFLSGGIDSGLITAMAAKHSSTPLKTFTVRFDGQYDESSLARELAQKYFTDHTEISIKFENLFDNIQHILTCYGEPFMDSSAIPSYLISQEAKKYVTVILNGDGADELFGGYRRYVPYAMLNRGVLNSSLTAQISLILLKMMSNPKDKQSKYNYLFRLVSFLSKETLGERYLSSTTDIFEDFLSLLKNTDTALSNVEQLIKLPSVRDSDALSQLMALDFQLILFGDLLVKMDIATMQHALECRSPFLSKYILELAPTLPTPTKIKKRRTKVILRDLAKKYLPESFINQPKRGFEVPLRQWIDGPLKAPVSDLLSGNSYVSQYLQLGAIQDLFNNKIKIPPEKRAKMLWALMSVEIWHNSLKG